jgi:hypothetical protein
MAYQDAGKEMQARADALVKAVNSALADHYKTTKTKASDQLSLSVATGKGAIQRTPAEQADFVLKQVSWTMNSSHMSDGAKHINLKQGPLVTWALHQISVKDKAAFAVMTKAWDKAMAANDIRNFSGGKKFDPFGGDAMHMELPDSRLKDNDKRVEEALEIYAKATRIEGRAKNLAFETKKGSQFQKDWLKTYDQKLAREAAAKAAKKGH